ncbi:E3 ubiquitin-protein ligase UPL4 isoform X2 [Aristolochia californica]|uniref:E3 ubiquitin-protein ligase UPL4 isoform X2 n=1 Tax=Aristolochia californica TaxID=171875 RepID=UPI0035D85ECF
MENRGRKRTELLEQLPADKRACSLPDHRPSTSSLLPSTSEAPDCEMETSSSASVSGRSDKDSAYGSCDSDGPDHDYNPRNSAETKAKFKRILSALSDEAGPSSQLAALTELCDVLLLCTESSLSSFSWETFVPILVTLAKHDSNPNIMLFAVRALAYLCDVMPRSAMYLVRYDAVPALVAPLLGIEYLDVAEQCLQALEKITRVHPASCLQAGAIMAVLNYIDFFSPSIQNVALSTVANICKKLPSDSSSYVMEAIPILCNLLQYEDQKLVENVVLCLIRIVEGLSDSSETLDELCKHGLIEQSRNLTINGRMTLSRPTYTGLIGMLSRLASHSSVAVRTLFELNISSALRNILLVTDLAPVTPFPDSGETDSSQVHEALKLLNAVLPPLDHGNAEPMQDKDKTLIEKPELLDNFGKEIFPALVEVVNSGASSYVFYGCLSVINKLVYFSSTDALLDLLKRTNIASFLAGVFARKDRHILVSALKTTELLMKKLPGLLLNAFVKEGVLYAIDALQVPDRCSRLIVQKSENSQNSFGTNQRTGGTMKDVPKCLCYAFDVRRPSVSLESGTCKIETVTVQGVAKYVKATYFTGASDNSDFGLSEILQRLRTLSAALNSHMNSVTAGDECSQHDILLKIMMEINNRGDPLSTFEFIESGIVRSLADYLSGGMYRGGEMDHLVLLKRFQLFARVSLLSKGAELGQTPLMFLIRKLQSALSLCSLDHFPVIHSHASKSRNYYANIPSGHYTKYPCLKVRFVKGEGEKTLLCDYSQDILLVEPFTSLDDIEGFLWPKVSSSKAEVRDAGNRDEKSMEKLKIDSSADVCQEIFDMMETIPSESSSVDSDRKTKLNFFLAGKQLARSLTIYQSILQEQVRDVHEMTTGPRFWNEIYTLTYKKAAEVGCSDQEEYLPNGSSTDSSLKKLPFSSRILVDKLPCNLDKTNPAYDILVLLKVLEGLNKHAFHLMYHDRSVAFAEGRINDFDELKETIPTVPQVEFLSNKLTEKLEQQIRDPLAVSIGGMPVWCGQLIAACPFLFSFEARRKYFRLAAFGPSHVQLISHHQRSSNSNSNTSNRRQSHSSGMPRERFQVCRDNIMESASQMMDLYASSNVILEVEYKEEVGTGLGPTMEFYTLISHEFQKAGLGMWREDHGSLSEGSHGFVTASFGLFPRPWPATSSVCKGVEFCEVIKKFALLGQIVAKAVQDGRVLDLPISRAFYKLVLGQELDIYDILLFDPQLGRTLLEFQALANKKKFLGSISPGSSSIPDNLCFHDTSIEDLCLDFTLPGYSDYKLACGHDYNMVNINNLADYVSLVVDATVRSGIIRQLEAFKSGFNQVFSLTTLQMFTEDEIERLLCGEKDTWSGELLDHVKFDHGYTASSPPIVSLLEIIEEFECDQRRAFLQFVTGAPRLPPGGLAALNPKLTIVRKHFHDSVDGDLPSVMTCANYLKLPAYSSKERMRERLLYAITEGQGSFHLS